MINIKKRMEIMEMNEVFDYDIAANFGLIKMISLRRWTEISCLI